MEYVNRIIELLTPPQWRALIFLLLITSAVTETVKRVFLLKVTAAVRKRVVYAVAFVTGITSGLVGWAMVGTAEIAGYWWLTFGVIVGPAANFLHWLSLGLVGWKFPGLAAALKGRK